MNSNQLIKDLLKQGENEQLEFKESVRKDIVGKVICSFLNQQGGYLLIGVSDDKKVIGIQDAQKWKQELEYYLLNEIAPEAPVMVSIETHQKKELLLIKVWPGSKQPYVFGGSIYYRHGERTVQASSRQISELIHNRQLTEVHWERRSVLGVDLDELDQPEIQKTIDKAMEINRIKDPKTDIFDFMRYYGLYQNGDFTNAAVVLFVKNPAKYIPQTRIRVSVLKTGKTGDQFLDDQILEDHLFNNIEYIINFLNKHVSSVTYFSPNSWQRKNDLVYPISALREGILNALIHRDYSQLSGTVSVLIYPDRLEITNSGKLNLTIQELKKDHLSKPVNPDIAHIFYLRGLIEKIGRGTLKILEACEEAGLPKPEWKTDSHSVTLTFFNHQDKSVLQEIDGAIDGAIDGTTQAVKKNLSQLLSMISQDEGKRVPDYQHKTGFSARRIERYLQQLKEAGLIEFKGKAAQTGGYFLTAKMKKELESQ